MINIHAYMYIHAMYTLQRLRHNKCKRVSEAKVHCDIHMHLCILTIVLAFLFLNPSIDSITLAILGVIVYAGLLYLPGHLIMMMHFLFGTVIEAEAT